MDAIEPGAPLDVRAIVRNAIERDEMPIRRPTQARQEVVEHLAPRPGMQAGAIGEDSLHVEEAGVHSGREAEHRVRDGNRRQPGRRLSSTASELAQRGHSRLGLASESGPSVSKLPRRERITGRTKSASRSIERSLPVGAERLEVYGLMIRRQLGSLWVLYDAGRDGRSGSAAAGVRPNRSCGGRHRPSSRSCPASSFRPPAEPARGSAVPARRACSSSPTRCRTRR